MSSYIQVYPVMNRYVKFNPVISQLYSIYIQLYLGISSYIWFYPPSFPEAQNLICSLSSLVTEVQDLFRKHGGTKMLAADTDLL